MVVLCGYGCYVRERAYRRDFLLQNEVQKEREKSKAMLDNMLPPHVTERMATSSPGSVIADQEPLVTVLFCDILDFTAIVASLSPTELVTMLDRMCAAVTYSAHITRPSMLDRKCSQHIV